jgi:hypothetical protein
MEESAWNTTTNDCSMDTTFAKRHPKSTQHFIRVFTPIRKEVPTCEKKFKIIDLRSRAKCTYPEA